MDCIRLMIVDDFEPLRIGLRSVFESTRDIQVVADLGDGESAVREATRVHPDVILMDVRMPGMDGIEACRLIRDSVPGANVVMLTSYDDDQAAIASVVAGSHGFHMKDGGPDKLRHVVRAAAPST